MGILFQKIWNRLFGSQNEYKILILGLQNAGKTTLLYQLHLGKVIQTQPTIGSNVEEIVNKNLKLQVWDLGGQETIRSCWATYFTDTSVQFFNNNSKDYAVIFVIDSSEKKNEMESLNKTEFQNLINHDELKKAVFLILANKQDMEGAMTAAEISEKMKLHDIKTHSWHIQPCSVVKNEGIKEGLDWLTEQILENSKISSN